MEKRFFEEWAFTIISVIAITLIIIFSYTLPLSTENRSLFLTSIIFGVFGIVADAWKRQRSYEEIMILKEKEQTFVISITSHMAEKAYDYLIKFSEEYFEASVCAYDSLAKITIDEGNSLRDNIDKLNNIRWKYSPFITSEIETSLIPFEKSLKNIEAAYRASLAYRPARNFTDDPGYQELMKTWHDGFLYQLFSKGLTSVDDEPNTINEVVFQLRKITGFEDLTKFRDKVLKRAAENINE